MNTIQIILLAIIGIGMLVLIGITLYLDFKDIEWKDK